MSKKEEVYVWNETGSDMSIDIMKDANGCIHVHLTRASKVVTLKAGDDHTFTVPKGDD